MGCCGRSGAIKEFRAGGGTGEEEAALSEVPGQICPEGAVPGLAFTANAELTVVATGGSPVVVVVVLVEDGKVIHEGLLAGKSSKVVVGGRVGMCGGRVMWIS